MAKEYINKKCKICGKSLHIHSGGKDWRVACSATDGGVLITCWVGPVKNTKREAIAAWDNLMNSYTEARQVETSVTTHRLLLLI